MEAEEQLFIPGLEKKVRSCVFSGHRVLGEDFEPEKLRRAVSCCIDRGAELFYCGMAVGFDLFAAECVLEMKREYPFLKLAACIPCADQAKSFSSSDRRRYESVLAACDEKTVLSEKYYKGCMLKRNKYMADRSDALIAYCRKNTGGTAYTLKYFRKKGGVIFEI